LAYLFSLILKTFPIKDTLSLYPDYLYVGLMLFIFLILTRRRVNKKAQGVLPKSFYVALNVIQGLITS